MVMTTFVSCFNHSDAFVAKLRLSDLEMVCRTAHNPYNEPLPYHRLCPEGLAVLGDTFYVCDMGKRHHSTPWVTPCRMTPSREEILRVQLQLRERRLGRGDRKYMLSK